MRRKGAMLVAMRLAALLASTALWPQAASGVAGERLRSAGGVRETPRHASADVGDLRVASPNLVSQHRYARMRRKSGRNRGSLS